ncbi:efflux transporter periplasmic adaptor subunit, partial [Staphylococcus aureus]
SVRAQQANVDIAKKADRDGIITSPISGVITKRQCRSKGTKRPSFS